MRPENVDDLKALREWMDAEHYAPRTVDVYCRMARRAALHLDAAGMLLRDAEGSALREWWLTLPNSSESRNQGRKALFSFFSALDRRNTPALASLSALPKPHRLPRPLSADELTAFVAAARRLGGAHERAGLLFATTGARFTEVRTARWEDFTLTAPATWRVDGKGSRRRGPKPRRIPLHDAIVPVLAQTTTERRGFVFSRADGQVMTEHEMRRLFAEVAEGAGLEQIVPHQLRHTVATQALRATKDLRAVQELLGHASVATTEGYTRIDPEAVRATVINLPITLLAPRPGPTAEEDDDVPSDVLAGSVMERLATLEELVRPYLTRPSEDTAPIERHLLATALCGVERALDALEGGY